jgi:PAS domain S-box-containing protein
MKTAASTAVAAWPHRGEMAELIHRHDWASTSLGALESWPHSLRASVDLMLGSPLPMAITWGADLLFLYNDAYAMFAGARHPQLLGMNLLEGWPEVAELNEEIMAAVMAGQSLSFRELPLDLYRDGRTQTAWLNLDYSPLRNAQGQPCGWLAILTEITSQVLAQRAHKAAEEAYRRAKEQMDLALASGAVIGTWIWDVPTDTVTADPRFAHAFGFSLDEVKGGLPIARYLERIHPDDRAELHTNLQQAVTYGTPFRHEYRIQRPDGDCLWVDAAGRCELDAHGQPLRFPGVIIDIHERKLAEQQQRTLINELNHRVKNTLAIVQSIAMQSFRHASSVENATEVFNARLIALSRAHDVLTHAHWQTALLQDIARQTASAHAPLNSRRFQLDGPAVRLSPQDALSFAMAFHELATNAVKYGALGSENGSVDIRWSIESLPQGPRLRLCWSEHNGPLVAPPQNEGFGSRLIRRSLSAHADSEVVLNYQPSGFVCTALIALPGL